MNVFDDCCAIEQRGVDLLLPLLREWSLDGQFVLTYKGRLSKIMQKKVGDAIHNRATDGHMVAVEFKCEAEDRYGRFFLETWSNRSRHTLGWMYTLQTDMLWYFFIKQRTLYTIDFYRLREWAFHNDGRHGIYQFAERLQGKHDQLNDTWGRCVDISVIDSCVGFRKYTDVGVNNTTPLIAAASEEGNLF